MRIRTHNITRRKILDYLLLKLISHNKFLVGRCRHSITRDHVWRIVLCCYIEFKSSNWTL